VQKPYQKNIDCKTSVMSDSIYFKMIRNINLILIKLIINVFFPTNIVGFFSHKNWEISGFFSSVNSTIFLCDFFCQNFNITN
jgi:hypothetical protein